MKHLTSQQIGEEKAMILNIADSILNIDQEALFAQGRIVEQGKVMGELYEELLSNKTKVLENKKYGHCWKCIQLRTLEYRISMLELLILSEGLKWYMGDKSILVPPTKEQSLVKEEVYAC